MYGLALKTAVELRVLNFEIVGHYSIRVVFQTNQSVGEGQFQDRDNVFLATSFQ